MDSLMRFYEWDAPQSVTNGSHQQIFLCVLSATYGSIACISLFLYSYKLCEHLDHETLRRSGGVDTGNDDGNNVRRLIRKRAMSFFACFFVTTLVRSVNFSFGKSHLLFRNLTVDIPTMVFFVVYNAIMRCIWDTHSTDTRRHGGSTDDVAATSKISSLMTTGSAIIHTGIYIQSIVFMCQSLSVLDGISLYWARLFVQTAYLAGTAWLQAQEFATCLSHEKDGAVEVSIWQAVFSRSETIKKARGARPALLRCAVFLGVYSMLLKVLFTLDFMGFYRFDENILPSELDNATGFAIGNLFYYFCAEIVPFSYMIYLTAGGFCVADVCAQEKYLPLQHTEV